jgi:hypothetical protein
MLLSLLWLMGPTGTAATWSLDIQHVDVPLFSSEIAAVGRAAKKLARKEAPRSTSAHLLLHHACGDATPPACHDSWRAELSVVTPEGAHQPLVFEPVHAPSQVRAWRDAVGQRSTFPVVISVSGLSAIPTIPIGWSISRATTFRPEGWEVWRRDAPSPDPFPERIGIDEPATSGPDLLEPRRHAEALAREAQVQTLKGCIDEVQHRAQLDVAMLVRVDARGEIAQCEVQRSPEPLAACLCGLTHDWDYPEDDPHRVLLNLDYRAGIEAAP